MFISRERLLPESEFKHGNDLLSLLFMLECRDSNLGMTRLRKYAAASDSRSQPFRVVVAASAMLLADVHAHLSLDGEACFLCYHVFKCLLRV